MKFVLSSVALCLAFATTFAQGPPFQLFGGPGGQVPLGLGGPAGFGGPLPAFGGSPFGGGVPVFGGPVGGFGGPAPGFGGGPIYGAAPPQQSYGGNSGGGSTFNPAGFSLAGSGISGASGYTFQGLGSPAEAGLGGL